ncbi:DUF5707 domain-containing protein [Streptomyces sp. NPDC002643]
MSKRALVSTLIGLLVVGGFTAGGIAVARGVEQPILENSSVRYVAPSGDKDGSLTFTTDVRDDSGVLGLKVIAWPASSKLDPTEKDLAHVESATCESTSDRSARCTYELAVTKEDAAEADEGTWYISALATAEDGDTVFAPKVATFDMAG